MTEGTKDDMGKLQWDLIDYDFIEECVKVMQQGMKKYGYENWKKELDPRRIKNALLRHYMEYHRGKKIDNRYSNARSGKLRTFMMPELEGLSGDEQTPDFYIDTIGLFDGEFEDPSPSIETLLKEEYIIQTTYEDAFKTARRYKYYADYIHLADIAESSVYQVTPKGNGLIVIEQRQGVGKRRKDPQREYKELRV